MHNRSSIGAVALRQKGLDQLMAKVAHTAPLSISNGLELSQLFWGEVHADPAATAYPHRRQVSHRPKSHAPQFYNRSTGIKDSLNVSATQPFKRVHTRLELIELLSQLMQIGRGGLPQVGTHQRRHVSRDAQTLGCRALLDRLNQVDRHHHRKLFASGHARSNREERGLEAEPRPPGMSAAS